MSLGMNVSSVHAVVLAGGEGSRLSPLVSAQHPKAMLTIANRPMLFYSLFSLYQSSITNVTIIVQSESHEQIADYVNNKFPHDPVVSHLKTRPLNIDIHVTSSEHGDTADSLRQLSISKPYTLILSCDTLIDIPFRSFLNHHQQSQAVCTVALTKLQSAGLPVKASAKASKSSKSSKSSKPSSSTSTFTPQLYTILNESDRLLTMLHPTDLESSKAIIPKTLMQRYRKIQLRSDLSDSHVYCFHTSALDKVLGHCPDISSIKYDLIPYVSRRQHTLWRVADRNSWSVPTEDFVVSTYILPVSSYSLRANTISSYRTANLDIAAGKISSWPKSPVDESNPKAQQAQEKKKKEKKPRLPIPFNPAGERVSVSADCAVGTDCSAGDRTSVKKSVVGNGCELGSNVKLNGCVLLNNVRIMDGCNLTSCTVSEGVVIGASCVLKECRVAAGTTVDGETEATNRGFGGQEEDKAAGFADDLGDEVDFF